MAKELPYFRFTVTEWLTDDISLESYELKGLFADICAFYWFKDCSISLAMLHKRFSNATNLLEQLIELEIIKCDNDNSIEIKFLNEQYDLLSEKRKKRSEAGRIGGLKKSSNAKAMLKQKSSYKDKDNNKEKDKTIKYTERVFFEKSPELDEAFKDYLKLRSKSKYTMTDRAISALIKKLRQLSGDDIAKAMEIINNAILGKWKSFYSENK